MTIRVLIALCSGVFLIACATKDKPGPSSGESSYHLMIPFGADRHDVRDDEEFFMADTLGPQPLPEYPREQLGRSLGDQAVCVDVVVHPGGFVSHAEHNMSAPGCVPEHGDDVGDFARSAVDAVRTWQYFGAQICRFPTGVEPNDRCDGDGVEIRPVTVKLTYVFRFSRTGGTEVKRLPEG